MPVAPEPTTTTSARSGIELIIRHLSLVAGATAISSCPRTSPAAASTSGRIAGSGSDSPRASSSSSPAPLRRSCRPIRGEHAGAARAGQSRRSPPAARAGARARPGAPASCRSARSRPGYLSTAAAALLPEAIALITEPVPVTTSPAANTPSRLVERLELVEGDEPAVGECPGRSPSGRSGNWPMAKITVSASITCSDPLDALYLRDRPSSSKQKDSTSRNSTPVTRPSSASIRVKVREGMMMIALLLALLVSRRRSARISSRHSRQAMRTSSAPSRRATRAQSKATLPPPSTSDLLAHLHRLTQVDGPQELRPDQHAPAAGTRDAELLPLVRPDGHEDGVVPLLRASSSIDSTRAAGLDGHAGLFERADLPVQHGPGQPVLRDAVAQHAPRPAAAPRARSPRDPAAADSMPAVSPAGPDPTTATRFPVDSLGVARSFQTLPSSRSAAKRLSSLMATGSFTSPRRHPSSQGWSHTYPSTSGNGDLLADHGGGRRRSRRR